MASSPPRQDDQRPPGGQPHSPIRARSATSEDSQTLLLNTPPTDVLEEQERQRKAQQEPPKPTPSPPTNHDDDDSIQKCWICFSDSTEDTPETSPWRDPCPCALVAHEECLLDWIADTEAPKNNRGRSIGPPQITCPQCKAEIKLARPKDYVVESVRLLERVSGKLVTPSALLLLSSLLVRGSLAHGIHSIYRVFGAEDGFRILRPVMRQLITPPLDFDSPPEQIRSRALQAVYDISHHWRLYFGLPLITPLLILSRTSLADAALPALPVLFFASQAAESHAGRGGTFPLTWPPSAGMSFALLPYVRLAYNNLYERLFAAKERQWMREIQPRITQSEANNDGAADAGPANANRDEEDGDNVFEVRIDGDIWENWVEDEAEAAPEAANNDRARQDAINAAPAPPQQPPQNPEQPPNQAAAPPPPNIADNRPPQPAAAPPQNQNQGERRLSFSPTMLAETLLGSLLFPSLAELSGEILRLTLPTSWTVAPVSPNFFRPLGPTGILQSKWGRSLVGGCLFVVFKDAVGLYVKWRLAGMHRRRRVLDWDRKGRGSFRRG